MIPKDTFVRLKGTSATDRCYFTENLDLQAATYSIPPNMYADSYEWQMLLNPL